MISRAIGGAVSHAFGSGNMPDYENRGRKMSAEAGAAAGLVKFAGWLLSGLVGLVAGLVGAAFKGGAMKNKFDVLEHDHGKLEERVESNKREIDEKLNQALIRVHSKLDGQQEYIHSMHVDLVEKIGAITSK